MKYTVDRIENNIAILEDDMLSMLPVPMEMLPEGVKEGSILSFDGSAYSLDRDAEAQTRKRLFDLQSRILGRK